MATTTLPHRFFATTKTAPQTALGALRVVTAYTIALATKLTK